MLRRWYQSVVPQRVRRAARWIARELPIRMTDAVPDLVDRFREDALPPAGLRASVGIDSSRSHYVSVGRRVADDILRAAVRAEGRWLDFGCGSGRVARPIGEIEAIALTGVDVDPKGVRWCVEHLRGDYRVIGPDPPLPFAAASFDVIYAISVFTHLDEEPQLVWLAELRRVLRDGGMLVASLHGPELTYNRPDLGVERHQDLASKGFAFVRGTGAFNDDSAFHTAEYLAHAWSRFFRQVDHRRAALFNYQDLAVCIA